ncbi:MAG: tryptophan 2,3-dioxygenase family protein [Pirellulaceae bacterium]|nr:tryptophan 2,3-dioxygenase family protein [Pirellulaceae bacterium]
MNKKPGGLYYGEYLQLDKVLGAQELESEKRGAPAHDEMLFIIVHQAYDIWFKQMLYEIGSIIEMFNDHVVDDRQMGRMVARLERVHKIQRLLNSQIDILETMTPLDFLEFRDLLIPASGFQSVQFKELEISLGLKREMRLPVDREFICSRLSEVDRGKMQIAEAKPSLLEVTEKWLERLPFLDFKGFDFWDAYEKAVALMLSKDRKIIEDNPTLPEVVRNHQLHELEATNTRFSAILDEEKFEELRSEGEFRFSHSAMLAAIFINLYRDQPMLQLPHRYLTCLVEVDELFTTWRSRHAMMVHRMLGAKIGTGGSSGHDYLNRTAEKNRVFLDLFNLPTFLIPRSDLPTLPENVIDSMRFRFSV